MKKLRIINLVALLIAIVLEAIPYGIQMRWSMGEGLSTTMYHSYFDAIVLGASGDASPFLCSILTVVLFGFCVASLICKNPPRWIHTTMFILSWVAFAFSIMPLIPNHYTTISGIISIIFILSAEVNLVIKNKMNK